MVDLQKVNESYEVLNHTPVGICIINQDYEVIFWNNILANWTQIEKEYILNKKLFDVFPNLNSPKYLSRIETVLKGGAPTIFSSQLHKNFFPGKLPDGSDRIQHTTVASVPSLESKNEHCACIVIEDVSELARRIQDYKAMRDQLLDENKHRKQAEKAMRESENRLRAFMDSAAECFILSDSNLNILEINRIGKQIFNVDQPQELTLTTLLPEFSDKEWKDLFVSILETGEFIKKTITIQNKNEDASMFDVHIFKVNDGLGLIAEDITEQNQYESKLQYTLSELKRSNQELEQFGYIISHDLQEPLRMVSSYLQLIARKYTSKLDKDADEFIKYAVDGATRMQQMIKDLLRFSQFSSQPQVYKKTDLNGIVKNVLKDLSLTIEENQAEFEIDTLPIVMADHSQISQLFLNLISNSIKFKSKKKPFIRIQSHCNDNECVISVADNGIGIPEKETDRIFGMFQKLHAFDNYQGTGLGLTICKKIVECHNGRIWVESKIGQGSIFYFSLPKETQSVK